MSGIGGPGAYVPGDSAVHRADAVVKLGVTACFTVGLFLVDGFAGLLLMAGAVASAVAASRVPVRSVLRGLPAIAAILAFTVAANALRWGAAGAIPLVGPLSVDPAGLTRGLFFAARIALLVAGTTLVTLTTSPVRLASGIERTLRPAAAVGVPVAEIAMTLTIALRFIPTTVDEADRIVTAQTARGASFGSGGPVARARAYAPVLIPLFYQLFRRADALATAMEARGYRPGAARTRLHEERLDAAGVAILALAAVTLLGGGWVL